MSLGPSVVSQSNASSTWVEHRDEALRIITDELYERAQARTRVAANSDKRLKSGGRAKYLLSGLLVCNVCKAHYVIADARSYACSGHWNGGACSNHIRVRRDAIEWVILGADRPFNAGMVRSTLHDDVDFIAVLFTESDEAPRADSHRLRHLSSNCGTRLSIRSSISPAR
jgi:hypothetical protein